MNTDSFTCSLSSASTSIRQLETKVANMHHCSTCSLGDYNDRLQAMWMVKEKLPKPNLNNLK